MRNFLTRTLITLIAVILVGCNPGLATPNIQLPEHFPKIAEEKAGNIINGLANQDYEIFSKDFNPKMKAAIPSAAMVEVKKLLWGQNGEFQTMQTKSIYEEKSYFIGDFDLTFEKGTISMRVVYSPIEPYQVSGLWFPAK